MRTGFFKNPGLKALASVIAVALWVLVAGEEEAVRVFSVPIDFTLPKDRVLSGETPGTAQVRVRGSDSILRRLSADDMNVPIDLGSMPAGRHSIPIPASRSVRGVPSGVAVETVTPDRLSVEIERKVARTVGLSPRLEGDVPRGYVVRETHIEPDQISIEGPEGIVSRIPIAYTEPIVLLGRRESFTAIVNISIEDPRVRAIVSGPISVRVHIEEEDRKP